MAIRRAVRISDTPGMANVLRFNTASSALPPRRVLDAVTSHLGTRGRVCCQRGCGRSRCRIADVYDAVAALIGARSDEIAFMKSATRA
jgi:selenocysteine lyase/cysteine desulfurase